jgi:hypothetical protein
MVEERRLVMVREPQVEDPCGVECAVKTISTTVKKASKKEVETCFCMV